MTRQDEILALARTVFDRADRRVVSIDDSAPPGLVVVFEDEFGKQECSIPYGDLFDAGELQRSLESFRHNRESQIGEWHHQKKLSAELIGYLEASHDRNDRMRWLPKLVYTRFINDFHLRFPALENLANNPDSADRQAVVNELRTIPQSWQRSDKR